MIYFAERFRFQKIGRFLIFLYNRCHFITKRLFFRPLTWANLNDIYDLYRRHEIMKYISGKPCTFAQTKKLMEIHISEHERYDFGLCRAILKTNSQMIGRCGLIPLARETGLEGEIAWMFHQEYWNRGLATEFAQEMIRFGLSTTRIKPHSGYGR